MSPIVIVVFAPVVIIGLAVYALLLSAADAGIWEAVEERSPVDVPELMFVNEIEQFLGKVGRLLALHDCSSSSDVAPC